MNDQLVVGLVTHIDDKPQELTISELAEFDSFVLVDKALCVPITTVQSSQGVEIKPTKNDLWQIVGLMGTSLHVLSVFFF